MQRGSCAPTRVPERGGGVIANLIAYLMRAGALCRADTVEIKPHPPPGSECQQVMLEAPLGCFGRAVLVLHLEGMSCLPSIDRVPALPAPAAT